MWTKDIDSMTPRKSNYSLCCDLQLDLYWRKMLVMVVTKLILEQTSYSRRPTRSEVSFDDLIFDGVQVGIEQASLNGLLL